MLLKGSELTKEDRELQLYDEFEHFRQHKGESIHDYYVRFAKLINDIRNIKMTMSRLQLNSKFVNNLLPEWGRFVMAVKLNRGQRDSNYDQLYAYLKQHETYEKENKMMLERFSQPTVDPLALLSNVSNPQHDSPSSVVVQNVQGRPNRGQGMNPRGGSTDGYRGAPNRVGNVNPGQARPGQARPVKCYNCNGAGHIARNCTQPKRTQNSKYYKDKMLLMQAQENRVALDVEQLLFLEDKARQSYDSDVLSEVQDHDQYQDAACAHHEEHMMHDSVQLDHVVDSHADYTTDSNMIPYDQYVQDNEPALYNGHEIIKDNHTPAIVHNAEDTLEIAEITRKKMIAKMNDPECVTRKVKIAPHD
nr:hypothetical protein [Tanacetum cinerariifolium]